MHALEAEREEEAYGALLETLRELQLGEQKKKKKQERGGEDLGATAPARPIDAEEEEEELRSSAADQVDTDSCYFLAFSVCVCSVWVLCVALSSGGGSSAGSSPLCGPLWVRFSLLLGSCFSWLLFLVLPLARAHALAVFAQPRCGAGGETHGLESTAGLRNKEQSTVFYSCSACFVNTFSLNMYVSMSFTGLTRRITVFIFLWSRHRNT